MKKYKLLSFVSALSILPATVSAADFAGIKGLLKSVGQLIQTLTIMVAALALLAFMYGLMKFIFKSNDPKNNAEGKNIMIWGLLALFVMVSVWGIIAFFQRDLNITNGGSVNTGSVENCGGSFTTLPCN